MIPGALVLWFTATMAATPHAPATRAPGSPPAVVGLDTLLRTVPAGRLGAPLAALEAARPEHAAEAALTAGALHYARGEYRAAIEAYARAAARLEPARKGEPRYWIGVSWLALGEPAQARAAFEEVARMDSPRRVDAMIGVADCWLALRHPDRAEASLDSVV